MRLVLSAKPPLSVVHNDRSDRYHCLGSSLPSRSLSSVVTFPAPVHIRVITLSRPLAIQGILLWPSAWALSQYHYQCINLCLPGQFSADHNITNNMLTIVSLQQNILFCLTLTSFTCVHDSWVSDCKYMEEALPKYFLCHHHCTRVAYFLCHYCYTRVSLFYQGIFFTTTRGRVFSLPPPEYFLYHY